MPDRSQFVGASEVAALLGLSKWGGPLSVYLSKAMGAKREVNPYMQWGLALEGPILGQIRDGRVLPGFGMGSLKDRWEWEEQAFAVSAEYPHLAATPDLKLRVKHSKTPPVVVDVKVVSSLDEWANGGCPDYYRLQSEVQMGVHGANEGWMVALMVPEEMRMDWIKSEVAACERLVDLMPLRFWATAKIDPNPDRFRLVGETVERFWAEHVIPQIPPAADGSDATRELLGSVPREATSVELPANALDWVAERAILAERIGKDMEHKKELEARILAAMGTSERATIIGRAGEITFKLVNVKEHTVPASSHRRIYVSKNILGD